MPGILRGMARTAVVAGTATAVSGRVARRQAERYADRDAQIYAEQERAYQQQMAPAPAPPAAPAAGGGEDMFDQLQKLGELKAQGILTEAEFEVQKAKLLAAS